MGKTARIREALERVPRRARAGYTWLSAHAPLSLYDTLQRVARREHRSLSNLIVVLLIEALEARGEAIPEADQDDTPAPSD